MLLYGASTSGFYITSICIKTNKRKFHNDFHMKNKNSVKYLFKEEFAEFFFILNKKFVISNKQSTIQKQFFVQIVKMHKKSCFL